MKAELLVQLAEADEIDILELTKALEVAAWLRTIEQENSISALEMAKKLDVSIPLYKAMKNGCYSFNLRMIARIQTIECALSTKKNKKRRTVMKNGTSLNFQLHPGT